MARPKRASIDGLTQKERFFAEQLCRGSRPPEAYELAGYVGAYGPDHKPRSVCYAKAKEPRIVAYMQQWLKRARISDIDSPGAAVSDTLRFISQAEDDRNQTALAALQRLRYQHNGIAEKHQVQIEHTFTDAELLLRILGGDAARLNSPEMSSLAALLSPESFDEPPVEMPSAGAEQGKAALRRAAGKAAGRGSVPGPAQPETFEELEQLLDLAATDVSRETAADTGVATGVAKPSRAKKPVISTG